MSLNNQNTNCNKSTRTPTVTNQPEHQLSQINQNTNCHKLTRTPTFTQIPACLTQLLYPVHSQLYPDLCRACDC